jgi:hypothetical protein
MLSNGHAGVERSQFSSALTHDGGENWLPTYVSVCSTARSRLPVAGCAPRVAAEKLPDPGRSPIVD